MTDPIPLDELPARMRMLSQDMAAVGSACDFFGGFGEFGEYGRMLCDQSAPLAMHLATALEQMRGGRA